MSRLVGEGHVVAETVRECLKHRHLDMVGVGAVVGSVPAVPDVNPEGIKEPVCCLYPLRHGSRSGVLGWRESVHLGGVEYPISSGKEPRPSRGLSVFRILVPVYLPKDDARRLLVFPDLGS